MADQYPTPKWCVTRLLERAHLPGGLWLEPCAGAGNIVRAVTDMRSDVMWSASEIMPEYESELREACGGGSVEMGDFFETAPRRYDAVITNPPYRMAQQFITRCMELSEVVVMLLRVNFLASQRRSKFMREHTPDVYILPDRPSFTGKGTDSIEYGWFVWHGSQPRHEGKLVVLDTTPRAERKIVAATSAAAVDEAALHEVESGWSDGGARGRVCTMRELSKIQM